MANWKIEIGAETRLGGRRATFVSVIDFDQYMVCFPDGSYRVVGATDLDPKDDPQSVPRAFDDYSPAELEEAYRWYEALKDLLDGKVPRGERSAFVVAAALVLKAGQSTVWRRIQNWNGNPLSLVRERPNGGRGKSRMAPEREALMSKVIADHYMNRRQRPPKEVYDDFLLDAFRTARLRPPSLATFYERIHRLDSVEVIEKRQGKRAAHEARKRMQGRFPFGDEPLGCVQMDYWLYDVEIVDDVDRETIGRGALLALAIDVCTMMPYGYHLSLDPTGANNAGLAIFHGMTRKERWLKEVGFDMEWPVWGMLKMLHLDNAKEFRGSMLRRFLADEDGLKGVAAELVNRKVKTPRYGPHIERFFGTLAWKVKGLPGATGSNTKERQTRNSSKTAKLTLHDLELHLLSVLKEHTNTKRKELGGLTPLQKWRSYFFEGGKQIRPLPDEPKDLDLLRKELMPMVTRTVQDYGIRIDNIFYDSTELVAVRQRHANEPGREFIIRRDPRDISEVYVFDPDNKRYLTVPYRRHGAPVISQWEAKAAIRHFNDIDKDFAEADIFDFITERRERQNRIEEAGKLTTKVRKERAQQRQREKARSREAAVIASAKPKASAPPPESPRMAPDVTIGGAEAASDPYANVFDELDI